MLLTPKESGKVIASLTKNIKIQDKFIHKLGDILIEEFNSGRLSTKNFSQNEVHPNFNDPNALDWIFVVDTLNFCFWSFENVEGWSVKGKTGYFALCTAINRAIDENIDILNPNYYANISEKNLKYILRSDNAIEIPLFGKRIECLHEVGNVLIEKFNGSFENCLKQANNSAVKLLNLITDNFKCFKDVANYKGYEISIYKRAQILIGDIWACYNNKDQSYFYDINEITMFADYRVPQTLLWFEIFVYSEKLMEKLQSNVILQNGDEEEIEIRGCSIHAVELLTEYVLTKVEKRDVNSILIDHFLWDFRRSHDKQILEKKLPFHKTFCIYY